MCLLLQVAPISRHKNLNPQFDSVTTSSKTKSQYKTSVPKEPVKAAVKALTTQNGTKTSQETQKVAQIKSNQSAPGMLSGTKEPWMGHSASQPNLRQPKIARKSLNFNISNSHGVPLKASQFSQGVPLRASQSSYSFKSQSPPPPNYNSNTYVKPAKSLQTLEVQNDNWNRVSFNVPEIGSVESLASNSSSSTADKAYTVIDMKSPESQGAQSQVVNMEEHGASQAGHGASPPQEEREVEGGRGSNVSEELQRELEEVKSQLEVQFKVRGLCVCTLNPLIFEISWMKMK